METANDGMVLKNGKRRAAERSARRDESVRSTLTQAMARDPGLAFCGLGLVIAEGLLAAIIPTLQSGSVEHSVVAGGMIGLPFMLLFVGAYTIRLRSKAPGQVTIDRSGDLPIEPPRGIPTATPKDDPHLREEIPSDEAMVELEFEKRDGKLVNPRVSRISDAGKRFFGYAATAPKHRTIGRDANELMAELEQKVSPPVPHWEDLGKDQQRVYDLLFDGREAYARVPVRFNEKHAYFPNKTFLPLIVERGEFERDGKSMEFRKAIYLDITTIPTHLFSQHAWHEVGHKIGAEELQILATQFGKIREAWEGGDRSERYATHCQHVRELERVLREGGGAEVIHHCAEAGWFSLWEMAKALELGRAQQFLLDVAGSFEDERAH